MQSAKALVPSMTVAGDQPNPRCHREDCNESAAKLIHMTARIKSPKETELEEETLRSECTSRALDPHHFDRNRAVGGGPI
jgi:hypothetical protein